MYIHPINALRSAKKSRTQFSTRSQPRQAENIGLPLLVCHRLAKSCITIRLVDRTDNYFQDRWEDEAIDTELDVEQDERTTECGQRSLAWLLLFDQFGSSAAKMI